MLSPIWENRYIVISGFICLITSGLVSRVGGLQL